MTTSGGDVIRSWLWIPGSPASPAPRNDENLPGMGKWTWDCKAASR